MSSAAYVERRRAVPRLHWKASPRILLLGLLGALAVTMMGAAFFSGQPDVAEGDRASLLTAHAMHAGSKPADVLQLRAPGYPMVLAAAARLSPDFADGLNCVPNGQGCRFGTAGRVLIAAQFLLAVAALVLAYALAWQLSRSVEVAALTALLAAACGRYGDSAATFVPVTWYQAGALLSFYLIATALIRPGMLRAIGAGICIATTSLFEPTFLVVAPVAAALLVTLGDRSRTDALVGFALLVAAGATLAGMLSASSTAQYDVSAIGRHMSWHLAERVAFNEVDGFAWWAGVVLPIPILGNIAVGILPEATVTSFGYYTPGAYVHHGANVIFPAALARPAGSLAQLASIASEHIVGQPIAFLTALPPLLLRGLLAATGLIGLVGLLHVPRMVRWSRCEQTRSAMIGVLVCTGALLVVNTLLTANPAGLNPTLAFVFAFAIAYVATGL
jgi:uncharacterized membrane protein